MNPRTVQIFHANRSANSFKVAPFFRLSRAIAWAILLPSRGPVASFALAAFLALGAALAGVAFLVALPLPGAPLADCARPLAFLSGFGFAGAAAGFAASPSPWMRCQMRATAVLGSLSFLVGFSPGKLFRIASRRSAGQAAANSASSCSLANVSKGVVVVAAASSAVACAVTLFSESMV